MALATGYFSGDSKRVIMADESRIVAAALEALETVSIKFCVKMYARVSSARLQCILMIWIIYCFHINLMYQVQLMSVLTKPIAEKQITSPAEIISNGLNFGFAENFAVHLQRINDSESKHFIQKNRQCTFETCIIQMQTKHFATLGNRMYVQYVIAFGDENTKIFTFREPVAKSFVQMYMKKGFPLRDKLNYLIRRMVEIGYLAGAQNFYRKLIGNISLDDNVRFREDMFLSLEHFAGAFILLGIGCCVAIVAFSCEIIVSVRKIKL